MNESRCNFETLRTRIESQFSCDLNSVHGPSHWHRVEQNGLWIAARSGADPLVVRLFAWIHDSKRLNDAHDPEHGARAAKYAEELRGSVFELSDEAYEKLEAACIGHTAEDFSEDPTIGKPAGTQIGSISGG